MANANTINIGHAGRGMIHANKTARGCPMKRIVEIRPAEGGEDSFLFARELALAYGKLFARRG